MSGQPAIASLGRGARIVVGVASGVGATGIYAALSIVWVALGFTRPLIDVGALISLAALVAIAAFAGAVLRGPEAIAAIVAGAVASPIVAAFAIDGSCEPNMWVGAGLVISALYALVATGIAALVGDRIGDSHVVERNRVRGAWALGAIGAIGFAGWVVAVMWVGGCS